MVLALKSLRSFRESMKKMHSSGQYPSARPIEHLEGRVLFSTYVVTTGADAAGTISPVFGGIYTATTLRAAVTAANANPGTDTILLNPFFSGTITLTPRWAS